MTRQINVLECRNVPMMGGQKVTVFVDDISSILDNGEDGVEVRMRNGARFEFDAKYSAIMEWLEGLRDR